MGEMRRRRFLQGAAAAAGGLVAGGPLQALLLEAAGAAPRTGPLGPVPDLRDGVVRLHLPPEFQYRSFHDTDGPPVALTDGTTLPGRHDGMGAFPGPDGNTWLVRNHEVNGPVPAFGPSSPGPEDAPYDTNTGGGTTTSLVTPDGIVIEAFTSLNGTQMNCAGGPMPWGSWITCEETVNGPDVGPDFTGASNATLTQPHGFIFEVPAGGKSDRVPIQNAGRFAHEAAAYSPTEGIVYLTEDNFGFPSGLYRYIPPSNPMQVGGLEDGGVLEMLRVVGTPNAHLEAAQANGATYLVDWVVIDDPSRVFPTNPGKPPSISNNEAINYVGNQGRAQGAAHFSRLEGASFARNEIFFTSTQGGGAAEGDSDTVSGYGNGRGQIWSYNPATSVLTCQYQSPDASALDFPDNITSRGKRGAIVICEDGPGDNYIRGLARSGPTLFDIALNRLTRNAPPHAPRFGEEFAGAVFSPSGGTLYVNIQSSQGISFAIFGPWHLLNV